MNTQIVEETLIREAKRLKDEIRHHGFEGKPFPPSREVKFNGDVKTFLPEEGAYALSQKVSEMARIQRDCALSKKQDPQLVDVDFSWETTSQEPFAGRFVSTLKFS